MTKLFANICSLCFLVLAGISFHVGQAGLGVIFVVLAALTQFMKRWWRKDGKGKKSGNVSPPRAGGRYGRGLISFKESYLVSSASGNQAGPAAADARLRVGSYRRLPGRAAGLFSASVAVALASSPRWLPPVGVSAALASM